MRESTDNFTKIGQKSSRVGSFQESVTKWEKGYFKGRKLGKVYCMFVKRSKRLSSLGHSHLEIV